MSKKFKKNEYKSLLTTGTKTADPNKIKVVGVMNLLNLCSIAHYVLLYIIFTRLAEPMTVFKRLFVFVVDIMYIDLYMSIGP